MDEIVWIGLDKVGFSGNFMERIKLDCVR